MTTKHPFILTLQFVRKEGDRPQERIYRYPTRAAANKATKVFADRYHQWTAHVKQALPIKRKKKT